MGALDIVKGMDCGTALCLWAFWWVQGWLCLWTSNPNPWTFSLKEQKRFCAFGPYSTLGHTFCISLLGQTVAGVHILMFVLFDKLYILGLTSHIASLKTIIYQGIGPFGPSHAPWSNALTNHGILTQFGPLGIPSTATMGRCETCGPRLKVHSTDATMPQSLNVICTCGPPWVYHYNMGVNHY